MTLPVGHGFVDVPESLPKIKVSHNTRASCRRSSHLRPPDPRQRASSFCLLFLLRKSKELRGKGGVGVGASGGPVVSRDGLAVAGGLGETDVPGNDRGVHLAGEVVLDLLRHLHGQVCPGVVHGQKHPLQLQGRVQSPPDQPDESKEKKLCLALNRIDGRWDTDKLGDLLRDDDVLEYETGFDAEEVRVYRLLEDAREPDDDGDYPGDDQEDDEPEPEDDEPEPEDDEPPEDEGDTGEGDEEPRLGSTLIKIGHLSFKVEVYRYKRVVEAMRDRGIFDEKEIAAEWKRRLLHHD